MSRPLTRRQREVYEHLASHRDSGLPPPTLEELARALKVSSRGSMHKHISALVDAGLIEPMEQKRRGVRLAASADIEATAIPMLGHVAAGQPIEVRAVAELRR